MEKNTDLTNFWLAWYRTCSIRKCTTPNENELRNACAGDPELVSNIATIMELAAEVMKSTNAEFRRLIARPHGGRRSLYEDEAKGWGNEIGMQGSAFELLESHLYAKETINGRKFKDYLFEEIGERPGGMNQNLYGYFQRILVTIAKESFGDLVFEPVVAEDGEPQVPERIVLDGKTEARSEIAPEENLEIKEVAEFFRGYLDAMTPRWSQDNWIVLFCILNVIKVGSEKVRPLYAKGHDTINRMRDRMRGELITALRENFSDSAIGWSLDGILQDILNKKMQEMPCWVPLQKILEENRLGIRK